MDDWDKASSFCVGAPARRSTSSLGPMAKRLGKISLCVLITLVVSMISCIAVRGARSPGIWAHPHWLWSTAWTDSLFYVVVPLAALAIVAAFRPTLSTVLAVLIAIVWLTVICVWWAYKPWEYYGQFPWSGFRRHYLGLLPIPLSLGLSFGLCARAFLGPNNRFERSRAAASVNQGVGR